MQKWSIRYITGIVVYFLIGLLPVRAGSIPLNDLYGKWSDVASAQAAGHNECDVWFEYRPGTFALRGNFGVFADFKDTWPAQYRLDSTKLTIQVTQSSGTVTHVDTVVDANTLILEGNDRAGFGQHHTSHRCP